jgi:hypothetical protein
MKMFALHMVSKQTLTSAGGDNAFYVDRKFKMVDSEGQNCFENI